jgi:GxxExxY protein
MVLGSTEKGLSVGKEVGIGAEYLNQDLGLGFRADIIVKDNVLVEIKSIEALGGVQNKQLRTYLKLSKHKLGLLVNFNSDDISKSIIRIANNL